MTSHICLSVLCSLCWIFVKFALINSDSHKQIAQIFARIDSRICIEILALFIVIIKYVGMLDSL